MTLIEFFQLIKRSWIFVIAVPVICVIACTAFLMLQPAKYQATATLNVQSEAAGIGSIASGLASNGSILEGVALSAEANTTNKVVTAKATGPNADDCVKAANNLAEGTKIKSATVYESSAVTVNPAKSASNVSPSKVKYGAVAFIGGLFVAVCIVLVRDVVRRPVRGARDLVEATELPVLGAVPAKDGGERLLANVVFACGEKEPRTACVISASGAVEDAEAVRSELQGAPVIKGAAPEWSACAGPEAGMAGVYEAREADAAIVAVRPWKDRMAQLETTVAELQLSGANLVGFVLLTGKTAKAQPQPQASSGKHQNS